MSIIGRALGRREPEAAAPPVDQIADRHAALIAAELEAIDRHLRSLDAKLATFEAASLRPDFEQQELTAERRSLAALRNEIAADVAIRVDRDGRELMPRDFDFRNFRTRELREQMWRSADLSAAAGDHRAARMKRKDALRARLLAEYELKWRPSLQGY